jgi:hypothetical protein
VEVEDPEVHAQRKPFSPCQLQGPIVTSTVRRSRMVGDGVNGSGEKESRVEGVEVRGVNMG